MKTSPAWVQFFSWFALFPMWIYTTAAVTSHLYGTTDTTSARYNEGANWVGVGFATYNGVAAVAAFLIPVLAAKLSRRMAHAICLVCGAAGLLSIVALSDPRYLLVSMIGVGIAWASILSMPYAILTGALPASKMGYYMGVFNFFIVIPQIVAAALLGFLIGGFLVVKRFTPCGSVARRSCSRPFLLSACVTMMGYPPRHETEAQHGDRDSNAWS